MKRRSCLAWPIALAPSAWLSGCAGFDRPRDVLLSQAELQRLLEREFPRQRRVFELIDVTVARPTLRLQPDRNRIATELELAAVERLSGRSLRGSLALDYALRYEPSDASVRLANVAVQSVQLDLGSGPLAPPASRIAALLAERLLDDFVLYRADAERLRLIQRLGIDAADIAVTPQGIVLRFAAPR